MTSLLFDSPDLFRGWLETLDPARELGLAGGYREHPIAIWLAESGHPIILELRRDCSGILLYDLRRAALLDIASDHWIDRFCRALAPPDAYRPITAAESLTCLARILNQ